MLKVLLKTHFARFENFFSRARFIMLQKEDEALCEVFARKKD